MFESNDKVHGLEVLKHLRARGHDTVVFHTLDRDEIDFPFDGLTMFESLESDAKMLVDPDSMRRTYHDRLKAFLAETQSACLAAGIEYHLVPTDQPFEETLVAFLAKRLGISGTTRSDNQDEQQQPLISRRRPRAPTR